MYNMDYMTLKQAIEKWDISPHMYETPRSRAEGYQPETRFARH